MASRVSVEAKPRPPNSSSMTVWVKNALLVAALLRVPICGETHQFPVHGDVEALASAVVRDADSLGHFISSGLGPAIPSCEFRLSLSRPG